MKFERSCGLTFSRDLSKPSTQEAKLHLDNQIQTAELACRNPALESAYICPGHNHDPEQALIRFE
jgi:hypothetical protein